MLVSLCVHSFKWLVTQKEAVCSCISTFVSSFIVIPVGKVCQIYQKYIPLYEHYKDKNNNKLVQMSCTDYFLYTFHLSLLHVNFGQFKAKQVTLIFLCGILELYTRIFCYARCILRFPVIQVLISSHYTVIYSRIFCPCLCYS